MTWLYSLRSSASTMMVFSPAGMTRSPEDWPERLKFLKAAEPEALMLATGSLYSVSTTKAQLIANFKVKSGKLLVFIKSEL